MKQRVANGAHRHGLRLSVELFIAEMDRLAQVAQAWRELSPDLEQLPRAESTGGVQKFFRSLSKFSN